MKEILRDAGIAAAVALLAARFVRGTKVQGVSMQPNFDDKDFLLLNKTAYNRKNPVRGDVVVFRSHDKDERGKDKLFIKRVIAVPGDVARVAGGKVYVNGSRIDDSYTKDGFTSGEKEITVPEGQYFCLGDNRLHSRDSRNDDVECIPKNRILGKVFFRLFPFDRIGKIGRMY